MIEYLQIICDMDGHNIGAVTSFGNDELVTIRLVCGRTIVDIETPVENITLKDGKYCVDFRWHRGG